MKPSLETVKQLGQGYDIVPVYVELLSDIRTPISVLKALKKVSAHTFLLESADNTHHWGRYSFLGYNPLLEVTCKNHTMTIKGDMTRTFTCHNPAEGRRIANFYRWVCRILCL